MMTIKDIKKYCLLTSFLFSGLLSIGQSKILFLSVKDVFLAGTAKIKITPTTPIPMSGYGGRDAPFKGLHDDLFVRVIAFSDGVNKALLITTDLIGISNSIWEITTKQITKETGIPKEYVLLSATHTTFMSLSKKKHTDR